MKPTFQIKVEFVHIVVVRPTFSVSMKSSEKSSTNIFSETKHMILEKLRGKGRKCSLAQEIRI